MFEVSPFSESRLQRLAVPKLLTALALLGVSVAAHASSIVVDGGFESAGGGNTFYAGQSIDGGAWNVTLGSVYIDSGDPYVFDGNNSLNLTAVNPYTENTVSQLLNTVAGGFYSVTFWGNADSSNTFAITEDGNLITGTPISIADNGFLNATTNSSLFTEYTGSFMATSTTTMLDLTGESDPSLLDPSQSGSVMIDDLSITQTPEPGSIFLMLTGAAGLVVLAAKRRLFGAALAG